MLVLASTCYIYGITEFGTLLNRMGFSDLIKHADYFCLFLCVVFINYIGKHTAYWNTFQYYF